MKKFLLTLAVLVGCGYAASATETTLTTKQIINAEEKTDLTDQTFSAEGFSFSFTKNGGSTAPTYYYYADSGDNDIRLYAKNTMTVTAPEEMSQIVFVASDVARVGTVLCTEGAINYDADTQTYTWTGAATEVTFTAPEKADLSSDASKAGQFRFNELTITTGAGGGPTVEYSAVPEISPASGTYVPSTGLTVTITAADGAAIYYTTDGTNPTVESDQYTQAIVIMSATTVKAIAVEPGKEPSSVVTAVYKDAGEFGVNTIAEFLQNAAEDTENTWVITGNVRVVYQSGSNLYLQDMEAPYTGLLVYGKLSNSYNAGDVLCNIAGVWTNYYSTIEMTAETGSFGEPVATGNAPVSTTMGIENLTGDDQNLYIELKSVYISDFDSTTKSFTITDQKDDTIGGYQKFTQVEIPTDATKAYDVLGFISYYQAKGQDAPEVQVYPIAFNEPSGVENIALDLNAPAEYYSIDGVRVAAPTQGIYIVRQGNVVKKVVIRK